MGIVNSICIANIGAPLQVSDKLTNINLP